MDTNVTNYVNYLSYANYPHLQQMTIKIISPGKTKMTFISEGIQLYLKRLQHYLPVEYVELKETKTKANVETNRNAENDLLLKQIKPTDFVVLLDEKGKEFSSVKFAEWLQQMINKNPRAIVFVIGGAYGFENILRERANAIITLSRLTFTHEMARLIFSEQLYRAMTILRNEGYHHQ